MLIAIDDSEHRGKIIRYGLTLAKSLGADVTVTHVIDRSSVPGLSDLGGLVGYFQSGNLRKYEINADGWNDNNFHFGYVSFNI